MGPLRGPGRAQGPFWALALALGSVAAAPLARHAAALAPDAGDGLVRHVLHVRPDGRQVRGGDDGAVLLGAAPATLLAPGSLAQAVEAVAAVEVTPLENRELDLSGVYSRAADASEPAAKVVGVTRDGSPVPEEPALEPGSSVDGAAIALAAELSEESGLVAQAAWPPGSFFQVGADTSADAQAEVDVAAMPATNAAKHDHATAEVAVVAASAAAETAAAGPEAEPPGGAAAATAQASLVRREGRGSEAPPTGPGLALLLRLLLPRRFLGVEQALQVAFTGLALFFLLFILTFLSCARASKAAAVHLAGSVPPAAAKGLGSPAEPLGPQVLAALLLGARLLSGPPSGAGGPGAGAGHLRARVAALAPCTTSSGIERLLPKGSSYDCALSRPVSSRGLVRLQARVEGPVSGEPLVAPLTRKACVLYSAAAYRQLHDGVHPVTVAFAAENVDFVVSLEDGPKTRVEVLGSEVSLFDMRAGRFEQMLPFPCSPDHWQDFVAARRATALGAEGAAALRAEGAALEFQECALFVGAKVTLVGELLRGPTGTLSLQPLQQPKAGSTGGLPLVPSVPEEVRSEKVLVSDDPSLAFCPAAPSRGVFAIDGPAQTC